MLAPVDAVRRFLKLEAAGGIVLIAAAVAALILSNSPLERQYNALLDLRIAVLVGDLLALDKPLLLWVNDGLMAVFFLLIGLEIKREILEGELSRRDQVLLPLVAAVGGFVVPALIYAAANRGDAEALRGWAIPSATDIAFALGMLSLLGNRVPTALKVFLASLAIFDDLAAIVVIALFYGGQLSGLSLTLAGLCTALLVVLNRRNVRATPAYILVGIVMWVCVLKSGVHATLAGIIVGAAIPLRVPAGRRSPLRALEHTLHPWVAFLILPLFAFANAGVSFAGIGAGVLGSGVSVGIVLGLVVGKQLGVFLASLLFIRLGFGRLPNETSWLALYGVSLLTGIGFTMSLFIGTLAFDQGGFDHGAAVRLAVLIGSALSAVLGFLVLRAALPPAAGS